MTDPDKTPDNSEPADPSVRALIALQAVISALGEEFASYTNLEQAPPSAQQIIQAASQNQLRALLIEVIEALCHRQAGG